MTLSVSAVSAFSPATRGGSASRWRPEAAAKEASEFGFRIAQDRDLAPAHALAEEVMGMPLTPLSVLRSAHEHTKATAWVCEHEAGLTGTILLLPLTPAGEADLLAGAFAPRSPQPFQLCAPGDSLSAIYFWLFVGGDGQACRRILRTCLAWRDGAHTGVRGYARGATLAGCNTMQGLGFEPLPSALPDLYFIRERT